MSDSQAKTTPAVHVFQGKLPSLLKQDCGSKPSHGSCGTLKAAQTSRLKHFAYPTMLTVAVGQLLPYDSLPANHPNWVITAELGKALFTGEQQERPHLFFMMLRRFAFRSEGSFLCFCQLHQVYQIKKSTPPKGQNDFYRDCNRTL